MPTIEAMGRQVSVICSDTAALPEVTLGLANYYAPACDAQSLARAIADVLTRAPSPQHLRETADKVKRHYDITTVAKQYLDLWESLLE
jgi:glycosyltransferase involved in cell wall biosynthesis